MFDRKQTMFSPKKSIVVYVVSGVLLLYYYHLLMQQNIISKMMESSHFIELESTLQDLKSKQIRDLKAEMAILMKTIQQLHQATSNQELEEFDPMKTTPTTELDFALQSLKKELVDFQNWTKQRLKNQDEISSWHLTNLENSLEQDSDPLYSFFYKRHYQQEIYDSFVYNWKISKINQKLDIGSWDLSSDRIEVSGYDFDITVKLQQRTDNVIYISTCFTPAVGRLGQAGLKDAPQVAYVLQDVNLHPSGQALHHIRCTNNVINSNLDYNRCEPYFAFVNKMKLKDSSNHILNDTAFILVLVEPPYVARRLFSTDGTLTQRISNYKHKTELIKQDYLIHQVSPYFATGPRGYRMHVLVSLSKWGVFHSRGLSVGLVFLSGQHDDTLPLAFKHNITLTLFNQRDLVNHLVFNVQNDLQNRSFYFFDVMSEWQIKKAGFLVGDSIVYKIRIQSVE